VRLGRKRPFADLVARQLDLFAADHAGLLADCEAALRAYDAAPADEAEERYGDYVDLVDAVRDELESLRNGYARTLDAETVEPYEAAFAVEARRRFPSHAPEFD
jgi:hypothetical protein